jgi:hypothetical protein
MGQDENGSDQHAASGLRSTSETLDQLQAQLDAERAQHKFDVAKPQNEKALLLRDLAEARLELARRDRDVAFANAPRPSAMTH